MGAFGVDTVIPPDDPSETCYDPETIELLRQVEPPATNGDVDSLRQRCKVYAAVESA